MSQQLINHNADLRRLRDEGYAVSVRGSYLVVDRIPYVRAVGEVAYGALVSGLTLQGDRTIRPDTHVCEFAGDFPCDHEGQPLESIRHASNAHEIGDGFVTNHSFSSKPHHGYADYYEKMSTYAAILATPAMKIDPAVTARPCPTIPDDTDDDIFRYVDTASGRAGTSDLNDRLRDDRVAIVGLGGTGSYVLDLVAKTPVRGIHLFDDDDFLTHNAFRAPGAATLDELRQAPKKVEYLARKYGALHTGIVPHVCRIGRENLSLLDDATVVFLCLDDGGAKVPIIEHLEARRVPFIDSGLGIMRPDDKLLGMVRVTTSTPGHRRHVHESHRIPLAGGQVDAYSTNIQIAELNALAASLAVTKWKKLRGFYLDLEHEHHTIYMIDGNAMTNEDKVA